MREYLYIWHDPEQQCLVASGLEFKDFLPHLSTQGGIILLEHDADTCEHDQHTSLDFVPVSDLPRLAAEDIYSFGNFIWADYALQTFPLIGDEEIAELLFMAHMHKPLRDVSIPGLANQFLCYEHDDGWYLRLYYAHWHYVEQLLATIIPATLGKLDICQLKLGKEGFWLEAGETHLEERTHDIDNLLNRKIS